VRRQLVIPILAGALFLGACGGYDSGSSSDAPADGESAAAAAGQATGEALVRTGQTPLGEVLTTADGRTLYGLTDDAEGVPTCDGGCAETWPPLLVDGNELPAGLDPAVFGVAQRLDGSWQLTAGGSPLYTYAGDDEPGDVNGQGSGGVWFVAKADGQLAVDPAAAGQEPGASSTSSAPTTDAPATTVPPTTAPPSNGNGGGDGYGSYGDGSYSQDGGDDDGYGY
jgi:predicted lipoprotein with Yx(FWY)xxD motif